MTVFLVAAAILICAVSCSVRPDESEQEFTVLTISTADSGGTMYQVGSAISRVLSGDKRRINVDASTGSVMNIQRLLDQEVDMALISADTAQSAYLAADGSGKQLRAIGAVYISISTWMAPVSVGVEYVHDLVGMRVGIGLEHSATEAAALTALHTLGMNDNNVTMVNCGLGSGTKLTIEQKLDTVHAFTGAPIVSFAQLAEELPCRVLRYTPEELERICQSGIYSPAVLPAGSYAGQTEALDTFGVKCLLCVDASMDEALAYSLLEDLCANLEALGEAHPCLKAMEEEGFLSDGLPIPLHRGAEQFYREHSA